MVCVPGPPGQADVFNPRTPDRPIGDRVVPGPPGQADVFNPRTPDRPTGDRVVAGPQGQADVFNPRRPDRLTRGSCGGWAARSGRCSQSPNTRRLTRGSFECLGRQVRPMFSIPEHLTSYSGIVCVSGPPGQADVLNPRTPDVLLGDRVC